MFDFVLEFMLLMIIILIVYGAGKFIIEEYFSIFNNDKKTK